MRRGVAKGSAILQELSNDGNIGMLSGRWLEVAVAAYLIGMMLYGHYRGFIRIAVSVMSLFITLFAVRVAIPQTAACAGAQYGTL